MTYAEAAEGAAPRLRTWQRKNVTFASRAAALVLLSLSLPSGPCDGEGEGPSLPRSGGGCSSSDASSPSSSRSSSALPACPPRSEARTRTGIN